MTNSEEIVPTQDLAVGEVLDYGNHAGSGFENQTQDDVAIPFLNILQSNSPQVNKADEAYIPGAEAGMLHNTVTNEIYSGEDGVVIVPVVTEQAYVLWRPRDEGGGFGGRLEVDDPKVAEIKASGRVNDKKVPMTEEGLEMRQTFYIYALILDDAESDDFTQVVVIPFTSSKIPKYRNLMATLRSCKPLSRAPLYAHRVLLKTAGQSNVHGSFFNFDAAPAIDGSVLDSALPPGHGILDAAAEMHGMIASGTKKASYSSLETEEATSSDEVF